MILYLQNWQARKLLEDVTVAMAMKDLDKAMLALTAARKMISQIENIKNLTNGVK